MSETVHDGRVVIMKHQYQVAVTRSKSAFVPVKLYLLNLYLIQNTAKFVMHYSGQMHLENSTFFMLQ